ncbi:hypothetical protein [Pontibacter sp. SGAir0037]|uniref:hypothetical protein n=1 Tax=Pontibacter sp. SGAir0037 TaxID=2571030 RepID=UPI0010CCFD84|nr:hypothetical protein [Pontibacter sp. SGAir0037]QCR24015.1 hypothetical protein C1N53_17755 [Pontibacter sp. SGAir0037]
MKKYLLTCLIAFFFDFTSFAQAKVSAQDVASIEAITAAGLRIISGPKGQKRDMEQFKALFLPDAQLGGVFYRGDSSFVRITTVEQFADRNGPFYEQNGFFELQLALRIERFGNLATAFQTYDTRYTKDGKVEARGVNTYQLVYDKGRWWIASLLFTPETEQQKLPAKYLKN